MIVTISRPDADVEVEVEYKVTSYGYPAKHGRLPEDYDPGEGPEWEIEDIYYLDDDGERTVSAMKDLTQKELSYIESKIGDGISESKKEDYSLDYDPCAEDPQDDDICDQYYDPY